jgi:ABC-type lipopolysaccharide export system ATPase subunit
MRPRRADGDAPPGGRVHEQFQYRDPAKTDRRKACCSATRGCRQQGLTILLAEQGVDFSLAFADRVYVLEKGNIRYTGPAAELREDGRLRDRLLAL